MALVPAAQAQTDISSSYQWKQLKIGGGGFVTGLALHPSTANLIYARTDTGGAYKWNPSTSTWAQILLASNVPSPNLGNPDSYAVESIAVSKSNDQVVLVAVGTGYQTGRVLRSTDQGKTWSDSGQSWYMNGNGDYRQGGERLAVDPNNDAIIYFGSRQAGLWRSNNSAASWSQISTSTIPVGSNSSTPAGVKFVVFDPNSGTLNGATKRIYAGVAGNGVYVTNDAGSTWTQIITASSIPFDGKIAADGIFWVSFTGNETNGSLQKYDPSSGTVFNVAPNSSTAWTFAPDPFKAQRTVAGPGGLNNYNSFQITTDGGVGSNAWTSLAYTLSTAGIPWVANSDELDFLSTASLQFDPSAQNRLWFPEGTGVWRTDDESGTSLTWTNVSQGIENTIASDVIAPNGVAVTGIFDREGFYHANPDAYPTRTHINTVGSVAQLFAGTSLDFSGGNPNFQVLAEVQNNSGSVPIRGGYSKDGGNTWQIFSSFPAVGTGGNIAVSATDTTNIAWLPSTSNFGHGNIPYYSKDQGASWQASSGISSTSTHWFYYWGSKKALDADKVTSGKFYLITFDNNGTFYVSNDGGATYQQAPNSPVCAQNDDCHYTGQLKAVPGFANNVWSTDPKAGLYYTTDAGQTAWTKVAGVQSCYGVGFGKAASGASYPTVYIAGTINNQRGIYRSTDMGASWQYLTDNPLGIYNQITTISGDMAIWGRVYVGFNGNGFAYADDTSGGGTQPQTTPTPTFGLAPGTYSSSQSVTLSDSLNSATIYYTTDGSTPTTSSTVYNGAITVASTTTIKAIAVAGGYAASSLVSGTYTINTPVSQDKIVSVAWPASIGSTGSVSLPVQYSATTTRTLSAYMWSANYGSWEGTATATVSGSGSVTLTIPNYYGINTATAIIRVVLTDTSNSTTYDTTERDDVPVSH